MLHLPRKVWLDEYFYYQAGEHVLIIEPNQQGKTHLAFQMLEKAASPELPAVAAIMKPRDPAPGAWIRALDWPEIDRWPPPARWPWRKPPAGYGLWPRHTMTDLDADEDNLRTQIRAALRHTYAHGDMIFFADEVYGLIAELDLSKELVALWTRGGGMGAGLWAATQKPSGTQHGGSLPGFAFNSATHLVLGKDNDERNRRRFGEIGGVDPRYVSAVVAGLELRQVQTPYGIKTISDKLYIDKRGDSAGPYMCVIGP